MIEGDRPRLRLLDMPAPGRSPSSAIAGRSRADAFASHPAHGTRGGPVLYIGGEPDRRIHFTRIARRWQTIRLLLATTPRDGLQLAIDRRLRMVVLDAGLPDAGTGALMRALRHRAASPTAPIVVLGSANTARERATFLWAGASAYVSTPFTVAEVEQTVGMLLEVAAVR